MDGLSDETKRLIKNMMTNKKLSASQQKRLDACFLDTLPSPKTLLSPLALANQSTRKKSLKFKLDASGVEKRQLRSFETIVQSGVFEVDQFKPTITKNRVAEKEKLQNIEKVVVPKTIARVEEPEEIDEFDAIFDEISERKQFLQEMEEIGKDSEYRQKIHVEIAQRVVRLKKLHAKQ